LLTSPADSTYTNSENKQSSNSSIENEKEEKDAVINTQSVPSATTPPHSNTLRTIFFVLAIIALAIFLFNMLFKDVPRYTADQVLTLAKNYDPAPCSLFVEPKWEATYMGHGKWHAIKTCGSYPYSHYTFYEFDETTTQFKYDFSN
jgi:hypothetical protein